MPILIIYLLVKGRQPAQRAGVDHAPLELVSFKCERGSTFAYARGEVKNVSAQPLERVVAAGLFWKQETAAPIIRLAPLATDTLLPGHTSSFTARLEEDSTLQKCYVEFQTHWGERIRFVDKAPQQSAPAQRPER